MGIRRSIYGSSPIGAGLPKTFTTKTANYTAAVGDFVLADVSGGPFTVTLPSNPAAGALVSVKKISTGANLLTIAPSGSGTIDGDPTATTTTPQAGAVFEHVGSDVWRIASVMTSSGPPGPTGAAGSTGATGATGATGPAGTSSRPYIARRTTAIAETFSRLGATFTSGAVASGQIQAVGIPLIAGDVVAKITFCTGTTAAVSPTAQWFGLWSPALALLGVTNDDGSTAWGTATEKTLTLASAYTVPTDGLYIIGVLVVAGTPPSMYGIASVAGPGLFAPATQGRDTTHTGLTTPATAPSTLTLAANTQQPWAWVS